jgi:putative ABC transport system permease protein
MPDSDIWQDLRYAVRTLRKQPGFAAIAVLTIALGIGANSAIFALVDATLLRPLPFGNPERLVMVSEQGATSPRGPVSPPNMLDWNERSRSFEIIAGYTPAVGGMVMTGADGLSENVSRQWVTFGFLDALGIRPVAGRTFLVDDDTRRADVVVMSETFWRSRFNGDLGIVGTDIRLDGVPFTVVGVVPATFQLLGDTSLWAVRPITVTAVVATAGPAWRATRIDPAVALRGD